MAMSKPPVGGGLKKVLYTLKTVQRIGLKDSARALRANNACKACGLGMGGQRGGMTNELGEFPSVCNKSVQAQSTDIQPPIPSEIFDHPLSELRELSGAEIEQLGRLSRPVFKPAGADRYREVDWQWAVDYTVSRVRDTVPDRSFFYSSGRSSNEAGFVLQLLARLYGTNNVNNCSYYCHQATGVGLSSSIGTGTATVDLEDLHRCDLVFIIGANPASNHPRLIHKLKACRERGGDVIVINPAKEPGLLRFAVPKSPASLILGGTEIASDYLQPRIGTDLALLKGIAKAVIDMKRHDQDFIERHTLGFTPFFDNIETTAWSDIENVCGVARADIERVARRYAQSERTIFAWGMGVTHHLHGVENVEAIANLALLRGMLGKPGAGLLPLRGHSNVQGIGTIGVKPVLEAEVVEAIEEQLGVQLPREAGMDTLACLRAATTGFIDTALIMGGNLYEATPDTQWAGAALKNIPFKVFLTTTLNRGHLESVSAGGDDEALILPVAARDEERQPTTQESMFNYVRMSDGGIDRIDGVRPEVDVLVDIGSALLPDSGFDFSVFGEHRTIREAIAATVPSMQNLKHIDVAKEEFYVQKRIMHEPVFATDSGKGRFSVLQTECPIADAEGFPFTLATVRSEGQFNSIIYEEQDSYRGTLQRWSVLMNSTDMLELGVEKNARVDLASAFGEMKNVVVYPFDLPRGNVMAYYPEANVLTGSRHDPRSKTPNFKSIAVAVTRSTAA